MDSNSACTSASVLCERPNAERTWTPETAVVLWYCMAVGITALVAVGLAHWLRQKVRRGGSNGSDAH